MPAELYLFIPFWKLKVMKEGVQTSYKNQSTNNTLQFSGFKNQAVPKKPPCPHEYY